MDEVELNAERGREEADDFVSEGRAACAKSEWL